MRENAFRRYRLGQWVALDGAWLPDGAWERCRITSTAVEGIPDGADVVLGFDGSFSGDCTALVAVTVAERPHVHLVELWEAPEGSRDWRVPVVEVEDAIRAACRRWRVLEVAAHPTAGRGPWSCWTARASRSASTRSHRPGWARRPPGSTRPSSTGCCPTTGRARSPATSPTRCSRRTAAARGWPRSTRTASDGSTPLGPPSWPMTGPRFWPATVGPASTSKAGRAYSMTVRDGPTGDRPAQSLPCRVSTVLVRVRAFLPGSPGGCGARIGRFSGRARKKEHHPPSGSRVTSLAPARPPAGLGRRSSGKLGPPAGRAASWPESTRRGGHSSGCRK
jgi:hypothetical protein